MPEKEGKNEKSNADYPYDSVEVFFSDGTYWATFYIDKIRKSGAKRFWPSWPMKELEVRQKLFRSEGCVTPMIDKALVEIHSRLANETGFPSRTLQ